MADTKFKVGDRVKLTRKILSADAEVGATGTLSELTSWKGSPAWHVTNKSENDGMIWTEEQMELLSPAKPQLSPKFILQYELDKNPFEFFVAEKDVRKRIAELAERTDLKRDSIRLIEIKKIRTVKLGVKISISK